MTPSALARAGAATLLGLAAALGPARPCGGKEGAAGPAKDAAPPGGPCAKAPVRGAAPGDERGPGRFVARTDRTFYAAAGGRLWYYLNLYYWVPEDLDRTDLWIRAEVVAAFRDLRRWP